MGCDIHPHIEIKLNGKWQHWSSPNIDRWYRLFGRLAGVRCPDEPHPPIRGLPTDATESTLWDYEVSFGHTASWITWQELKEIQDWVEAEMRKEGKLYYFWNTVIGYLRGNDYRPVDEVTDIRMVFWFDN